MVEAVAIACTLLMATGQIVIKTGLTRIGGLSAGRDFWSSIISFISNPFVILGISLYLISAVTWIWVVSQRPLSYIYPFLALSYVFALVGSKVFLHEDIHPLRWIGVVVIVIGIYLISRT